MTVMRIKISSINKFFFRSTPSFTYKLPSIWDIISTPSTVRDVVLKLDKILGQCPSKKLLFGTWRRMRPDCFLASGHNSTIGLQVLACIKPLITAAEVIFKAKWPLYKTYTDFIKPENRVGIWPQAQFFKNIPVGGSGFSLTKRCSLAEWASWLPIKAALSWFPCVL